MVDKWNASVLSACFRSPLQFNCKLVRYCNIWLSCWTPLFWFSPLYPLVWITDIFASFVELWQTLDPDPWEGLVELLLWVCVNIVMFILTITFDWFIWLLWEDVGCVGLLLEAVMYLFIQLFWTPLVLFVDCCYVAEDLVTSQELKIKQ